ncbi:MAG TPA: undecaprenyl-phosphate glucose phosphotransferase [Flavihumibacter sp.]|nr:undecaprenyl-phosphate glucose phosphotransferase [Bacteroidota bacterium]HQD10487.1 undecaprenyl-phosphate glucose phosphotransferase [Flavihumibacter sp.]
MHKLSFNSFRILLWLWDLVTINLVVLGVGFFQNRLNFLAIHEYQLFTVVCNFAWMISVHITWLYMSKNWLDFETFFKNTLKAYLLTMAMVFVFIFLYHYPYSRMFILCVIAFFGIALLFNRIIFNMLIFTLRSKFKLSRSVVVLGNNEIARRLVHYFQHEAKLTKVVGLFSEGGPKLSTTFPVREITDLESTLAFTKQYDVKEIYSTLSPEQYPYIYELAKEAEKEFIHFKFVPDYQMFVNRNIFVDFVDDIPVLSLRNEPLQDTGNRIKKRVFDVMFSSFVIVFLLSWLIPIMAILIKLGSKGPVFFTQYRSGKDNQPFLCYKFRSLKMSDDADKKQVTKNDSRMTPLGAFMRKTNIDELPQFLNVFMGQMSVVGPRPHMLKHTEDFSNIYKQYMVRHFVKPGVTGWAQVNGFRGEIKDDDFLIKRIQYDLWYMENWSVWLDFKIIGMTIFTSVRGDENAY